jgi:hypothetical protein
MRDASMDLITIATFGTAEEAYLAKNLLAEEGVASFVEEAGMSGLLPNNPLFGAKLQVAEDMVDRARHILKEVDRERFEE